MQINAAGVRLKSRNFLVRERARAICELVSDPQRLEEEREFARKTRDKFQGISSNDMRGGYGGDRYGGYSGNAGGAGGKYGGFGSEDLNRYGYRPDQHGGGGGGSNAYDPYSRKDTKSSYPATSEKTETFKLESKKKSADKKKSKKKKKQETESEEEEDEEDSEDESEEEKPKKKSKKAAAKQKLPPPSKASAKEAKHEPNLLDMLEN